MPDNKGKKLADLMYGQPDDADKPAFGVFPQMKPRRSKQDPEAAKDIPRQLLRGWAAGTLGLPGDIEGLVRMLPGLDETPRLPTSEFYLDYLPGKAQSPAGEAAAGMGTLFGGVGSTKVARGALKAGEAAGKAGRAALETVGTGPSPGGLAAQRGVVKMPGGNWLSGNVERAVQPLKSTTIAGETPAQRIPKHEELLQDQSLSPESRAAVERHLNQEKQRAAIDKWVEGNLTNYIKKQMATPDDPVRKLAEEGVLHIDPRVPRIDEMNAQLHRGTFKQSYGEDAASVMGQSELARKWEDLADAAIDPHMAGMLRAYESENLLGANPWIQKLPEKELVSSLKRENVEGLGFDHIIDVLREDLAAGRIRPEQLNKVSMEQAVRRTYEYDQEMAKKMAEAQIKATEGMPLYKEYPEGYRWVELALPKMDALPEGFSFRSTQPGMVEVVDAEGRMVSVGKTEKDALKMFNQDTNREKLESALKYEGETMGHCVGGYCPDVIEGRSRIFSLRDAKGEPHVTVEVQPIAPDWQGVKKAGGDPSAIMTEAKRRMGIDTPENEAELLRSMNGDQRYNLQKEFDRHFADVFKEQFGDISPNIVQIKGKQNRAPKEDYLPFVQDFVRSGQWSDVRDFQNTGLLAVKPGETTPGFSEWMTIRAQDKLPNIPAGYYTPQELLQFGETSGLKEAHPSVYKAWANKLGITEPEGKAQGGAVRFTNNPDAMRLELDKPAYKPVRKAMGGEITADDLIIEERPL